jgi:transcriptional regulator with XRE-family HTH domain
LTLRVTKGKISCNVRQNQRRSTLEALRRARVDAGLTISELAKRAGVSRDTISHAERGRHSLQGPTMSKIAYALGRAPSELLAEEERRFPKAERRSSPEPSLFYGLEEERRSSKTVTGGAHLSGTGKLTAAGEVVARIMQIMDKRREEQISDEEVVAQIRELLAA